MLQPNSLAMVKVGTGSQKDTSSRIVHCLCLSSAYKSYPRLRRQDYRVANSNTWKSIGVC